jgi:hypothetical protein
MSEHSEKPTGSKSVMLRKIVVYQDAAMVGSGWVLTDGPTMVNTPVLVDFKGELLPTNQMYTIQMTDSEQLVVTPERVQ